MRKRCFVLTLGLCLALVLATLGCSGAPETTVTVMTTSTTLPPSTTTTTEEVTTTTTTTEAPGAWTQLTAQNAAEDLPGARMGSTLALPQDAGQLLMFGGWDGSVFFDSVWSYDLASDTWADMKTQGNVPKARALHATVYLPDAGRLLVFGGYDGAVYLGDTWSYDVSADAWTNLAPSGDAPEARDGHSLVYDEFKNRVLLFGGWNGAKEFNDTWAYDPLANTWTELKPEGDVPAARDSQAAAYDSKTGKVVLFGGWNQTRDFDDTWIYDPVANTWANADPAGERPSGGALMGMVCEAATGKMILFGGGTTGNAVNNDVWIYSPEANTWAKADPTGDRPAARTGHALVYDSAGGRLFLFGGSEGGTFFNDVWAYHR